jgi:hypothetical protein
MVDEAGVATRRPPALGSVETEHRHERIIDGPQFLAVESTDTTTESLNVHCTKLFHQHARRVSGDPDLRTK